MCECALRPPLDDLLYELLCFSLYSIYMCCTPYTYSHTCETELYSTFCGKTRQAIETRHVLGSLVKHALQNQEGEYGNRYSYVCVYLLRIYSVYIK